MKFLYSFVLALVIFSTPLTEGAAQEDGPQVKKSKTGICHAKGTRFYNQTKNFTPFNSMDECIKSGGRPPKV